MKKVANMVKCKRDNYTTKQSLFVGYTCILLKMKHLSFATSARSFAEERICYHMHSRLGEALSHTNLHLKPHDYWINYGNILHGISVTEMYMSLYSSKE